MAGFTMGSVEAVMPPGAQSQIFGGGGKHQMGKNGYNDTLCSNLSLADDSEL